MPPIDVKHAVATAKDYAQTLFEGIDAIRLEEVELVDNPSRWEVTLSFEYESDPLVARTDALTKFAEGITGLAPTPRRSRHFKTFSIDANNGEVRAMKIRKL